MAAGLDPGERAVARVRREADGGERVEDEAAEHAMRVEAGPAFVAERDMRGEKGRERIGQRPGGEGGEHRIGGVVHRLAHLRNSLSSWRRRSSARRRRDFTVPSGRLVWRLISWCVSSPK